MLTDLTFTERSSVEVARLLLGYKLVRALDGQELSGMIVETEAYDESDAASHSYKGRTPRTDVMFGPSGHLYVYFTYGMHYCCNVVTGKEGSGSAVLIRALAPIAGIEDMRERRGRVADTELTNGPAKLCQALMIDRSLNGHDLHSSPLRLEPGATFADEELTQTTRIGISKDKHRQWRFYVTDSPYVSRP